MNNSKALWIESLYLFSMEIDKKYFKAEWNKDWTPISPIPTSPPPFQPQTPNLFEL